LIVSQSPRFHSGPGTSPAVDMGELRRTPLGEDMLYFHLAGFSLFFVTIPHRFKNEGALYRDNPVMSSSFFKGSEKEEFLSVDSEAFLLLFYSSSLRSQQAAKVRIRMVLAERHVYHNPARP
jgi:hypothetical protein